MTPATGKAAAKPPVYATRYGAQTAAMILGMHPDVHSILLFGSIARGGVGRDIDLILVTDDETALAFIGFANDYLGSATRSSRRPRDIYGEATFRARAAEEALSHGFGSLLAQAEVMAGGRIDLFVFPPDWLDRLGELQDALPHRDPEFMQNLAREAIQIG